MCSAAACWCCVVVLRLVDSELLQCMFALSCRAVSTHLCCSRKIKFVAVFCCNILLQRRAKQHLCYSR